MAPRRAEPQVHNRIAVLRAERQVSRQALADTLGINYQTIGYLERGEYNPSLALALAIASYFGLPVEAVFSRSPFEPMSAQLYPRPAQRWEMVRGSRGHKVRGQATPSRAAGTSRPR